LVIVPRLIGTCGSTIWPVGKAGSVASALSGKKPFHQCDGDRRDEQDADDREDPFAMRRSFRFPISATVQIESEPRG
jgi:hypothetical protein